MMLVYVNLRDKNTGEESTRSISPLREAFRRHPMREIEEWIQERGNRQASTPTRNADLEVVSYFVKQPCNARFEQSAHNKR